MHAFFNKINLQIIKAWSRHILFAFLIVGFSTLVCLPLREKIIPANLVSIYLIGIVIIASKSGIWPSIIASFMSVLAFNFFFTKPYHSFEFYDRSYYFTFGVMLLTSLIVGSMTARLSKLLQSSRIEEQINNSLFEFTKSLSQIENREALFEFAEGFIAKELKAEVVIIDHNEFAQRNLDLKSIGEKSRLKIELMNNTSQLATYYSWPINNKSTFNDYQIKLQKTYANLLSSAITRINASEQAALLRAFNETEKLRNVLLSSLSHDLRTPLTIMNGTLSNLFKYRKSLPREGVNELSALWRQLDRLQKFVTNLLRMASISSGNLSLNKEYYGIQEIIGAALLKLGDSLGNRKVLSTVIGQMPFISVDGALIEQVLFNLLDNAISHTKDNGTIEITMNKDSKFLIVTIEDDGNGIPDGQETQIFQEFKRGSNLGDGKSEGTGLGLAICKGIMEAHGGKISAKNRKLPAKGACFKIMVPLESGNTEKSI